MGGLRMTVEHYSQPNADPNVFLCSNVLDQATK